MRCFFLSNSFSSLEAYLQKEQILSSYPEVSCLDFYRDLFPLGSFEKQGEPVPGVANGVIFHPASAVSPFSHHDLIFDDLSAISEHLSQGCFMIAPCSFFGKSRTLKNSHLCYALAVDIDDVGEKQLLDLIHQCQHKVLPMPTYIVNSGGGVHLYYFFENPIPMYPQHQQFLKELKIVLTERVWNAYTSLISTDNRQYQGIVQAFRAVGSVCKFDEKFRVKAYRVGRKVYVDELTEILSSTVTVPSGKHLAKSARRCLDLFEDPDYIDRLLSSLSKSELARTLKEAKELWPDWYERRVVQNLPPENWRKGSSAGLYKWWLKRIRKEIIVGHRYNAILTLGIFSQKCQVPFEQFEADAWSLFPYFASLSADKPFYDYEVETALKAIKERNFVRYTKKEIERLTALNMTSSAKRNGRKQDFHLALARSQREKLIELGQVGAVGGRPTKEKDIREYLEKHPNEKNRSKVAAELGMNRDTVAKWMKIIENEGVSNG